MWQHHHMQQHNNIITIDGLWHVSIRPFYFISFYYGKWEERKTSWLRNIFNFDVEKEENPRNEGVENGKPKHEEELFSFLKISIYFLFCLFLGGLSILLDFFLLLIHFSFISFIFCFPVFVNLIYIFSIWVVSLMGGIKGNKWSLSNTQNNLKRFS